MIDHLNNIHRVPRGENLRNMTKYAQKTFVFVKEEGFNITMLEFPNMKGKNDDEKVLYSCPIPDCFRKFCHPKTSFVTHFKNIHKITDMEEIQTYALDIKQPCTVSEIPPCPICGVFYATIWIIWKHLKDAHQKTREEQMQLVPDKDVSCDQCGKIFQSRNLTEHKRGVHTNKNRLLAIKRRLKREVEGLVKTEFKI